LIYDAIVAGLGGMGSSTLAHAAGRGLRVLGLEQFSRGHDRGSSAGESRIIRQAYFEDPAYVPLVQHAYARWRALEVASGRTVYRETGVLLAGSPHHASVQNARASALLHGIRFEELDATQIAQRYPRFAPRPDEIAIFEPAAGLIVPEAAIEAALRLAEGAGAELRFATPLRDWRTTDHGTIVVAAADGERFEARRLALCLGPWFEAAACALGIPLVVERRVQHWFAPAGDGYGPADVPTFLLDRDEQPSRMYGFPDLGAGVKAAFHALGAPTHADALDRTVTDDDIAPLHTALEAWMPGATAAYARGKVCMYTLTPDEHFVLGLHPHARNVVLAGGFSGHGFKFAAAIGDIVTDLLIDGATRHPIDFLSPKRFRSAAATTRAKT
jgi:sarcosine oxidase